MDSSLTNVNMFPSVSREILNNVWSQFPIASQAAKLLSETVATVAQQSSLNLTVYFSNFQSIMQAAQASEALKMQHAFYSPLVGIANSMKPLQSIIAPSIIGQFGTTNFAKNFTADSKLLGNTDFLQLGKTASEMAKQFLPSVTPTFIQNIPGFASGLSVIGNQWHPNYWFPRNLRVIETDLDKTVMWIEHEEGISLFFILDSELSERIITSDSKDERRELLTSSFETIIDDCRNALGKRTSNDQGNEYVKLLTEALSVSEAGCFGTAEALLASILDSLINEIDDKKTQNALRNPKGYAQYENKMFEESQDFRKMLALGAVSSVFIHYPSRDQAPEWFARNTLARRRNQLKKTRLKLYWLFSAWRLTCSIGIQNYK